MNAEEASLLWNRKNEVDQLGGSAAHRQLALKHLKLKTVIKESHASPVHQLVFKYTNDSMQNLFATVGKDQATVYDDLHMGDFIAVVVNFTNQKTEHAEGGDLHVCTWINSHQVTRHPHGDALLAVAGADHNISLISIVEARVVSLFKGHLRDVTDLAAPSDSPGLLVSLSKDGNIRLWHASHECCTASYASDASSLGVSPDGQYFVTGGKKGALHKYQIPDQCRSSMPAEGMEAQPNTAQVAAGACGNPYLNDKCLSVQTSANCEQLKLECSTSNQHTDTIDCMRFLSPDRLATKSVDGRMNVWDLQEKKHITTWKVPCSSLGGGLSSRCQFGATPDGAYICVGNTTGDVYVYDTSDGKRMTHVSPIKVSAPVRACGLSPDCRHLLAVVGNGFIFRFEYRRPDAEVTDKENVDANMVESDDD